MELNLLVPAREGKFFSFDKKCEDDLKRIREMKEMGFSLQEIKKIMILRRFSKMTTGQELDHYGDFFENKMAELLEKRSEINQRIQLLEEKIDDIENFHLTPSVDMGLDLMLLSKLSCPDCKGTLSLDQAEIRNNMIMEGILKCSCDYKLRISNGILIDDQSMKKMEEPDESYFIRYINETNKKFLDSCYTAMEWGARIIDAYEIKPHEVFLEIGVGNGVFLSHIIDSIPDNNIYMAVDYDIYKIEYIKKMIERSGLSKKIVFICADVRRLPIVDNSVDYLIDFFGSTAYSYSNSVFLHDILKNKYNNACSIVGMYMDFNKFKENDEISEDSFHLFKRNNVKKYFRETGFKCIADEVIGYADEGGTFEQKPFEITDRVYIYGYSGKLEK